MGPHILFSLQETTRRETLSRLPLEDSGAPEGAQSLAVVAVAPKPAGRGHVRGERGPCWESPALTPVSPRDSGAGSGSREARQVCVPQPRASKWS